MSFGEQLQEVRRSNGMTQEQFAEAIGRSVSFVGPQLPGGG